MFSARSVVKPAEAKSTSSSHTHKQPTHNSTTKSDTSTNTSTYPILRIARRTSSIDRLLPFYIDALGFALLSRFNDHDGYDGVIIGHQYAPCHMEFTQHS